MQSEKVEQAQQLPDSRTASGSPDRFGYSWDRFPEPTEAQEEQFRRWTAVLGSNGWFGKRIFDVGCGAGRNSLWAMRSGASGGVAIDVDDRSLQHAVENLKDYSTLKVEKKSIYDVGFDQEFDIAFSIGVIHHLVDPETALLRMAAAVKPGGHVLIWLYGFENNEWIVRWWDPLRRWLFSRMPLPLVHLIAGSLASVLWCWLRLGWGRGPYMRQLRAYSFLHLRHIVFDHMVPRIARYYRREEAVRLVERAGLRIEKVDWVNEMSWTILSVKGDASQYTVSEREDHS